MLLKAFKRVLAGSIPNESDVHLHKFPALDGRLFDKLSGTFAVADGSLVCELRRLRDLVKLRNPSLR